LTDNDWDSLLPVAEKRGNFAAGKTSPKAIFSSFAIGVSTNRDDWVTDFAEPIQRRKSQYIRELTRMRR